MCRIACALLCSCPTRGKKFRSRSKMGCCVRCKSTIRSFVIKLRVKASCYVPCKSIKWVTIILILCKSFRWVTIILIPRVVMTHHGNKPQRTTALFSSNCRGSKWCKNNRGILVTQEMLGCIWAEKVSCHYFFARFCVCVCVWSNVLTHFFSALLTQWDI